MSRIVIVVLICHRHKPVNLIYKSSFGEADGAATEHHY
jgi:hypothetical protein